MGFNTTAAINPLQIVLVVIAVLVFLGVIMLQPIFYGRKNVQMVVDKEAQNAIDTYNRYIGKIRKASDRFIQDLDKKQREVILNRDGFANQKCVYLVEEFNKTSDILSTRLSDAKEWIDCRSWSNVYTILADLDKDIEYLDQLRKELEMIQIEPNSFESVFSSESKDSDPVSESTVTYFGDCVTREEATERFRALAKVFHPDAKAGNEAIFRRIKDEYDEQMKQLPQA